MKIKINDIDFTMDLEAIKRDQLFMEYRELLLDMVSFCSNPETVEKAKEHIYKNYEQYREFIQTEP